MSERTRESIIEWRCSRCREGGKFANLPDTTLSHVRQAVRRGHERRAPACHDRRGITKVKALFNGRTISFEKIEQLAANAGAVDGEDTTTATISPGDSMQESREQDPTEQSFGAAHGEEGSSSSIDPGSSEGDRTVNREVDNVEQPPKETGADEPQTQE